MAATKGFLADLAARWDGERILLVAHSTNRWALDCLLADVASKTSSRPRLSGSRMGVRLPPPPQGD
ncbi:hypothetical protein [Streptomyces sp. NRRL S-1521]|uniref:hypothetical protein n=1 Tax=Streptomyces sp. NRRL S-1521 TaxID=1609100 RepID=UPI001F1F1A4F|nr:hypothetical protein [Streptomyces sp. NRRL S-1521]